MYPTETSVEMSIDNMKCCGNCRSLNGMKIDENTGKIIIDCIAKIIKPNPGCFCDKWMFDHMYKMEREAFNLEKHY
jgi:hypothetical protein